MDYVIGIDGGATKTLLKMADLKGNLITRNEYGSSNINTAGIQEVKNNLRSLIYESLKDVGADLINCKCLCIGTSGAGREKEKKIIEDIIKDIGFNGRLIVTDDIHTAFYGGVGEKVGMIIISGTGSICYGRNSKGESARAGGWGYIIGDEGSGYYIGRMILNSIARNYDKREAYTALTSLVLKQLKLKGPEDLIEYVYRSSAGRKEISELARVADEACALGDIAAKNILENAAAELFNCANTVIKRLGFSDKKITIAVHGSILVKSKYVRNEFARIVGETYPLINVSSMKNDAAWGAVMMALNEIKSIKVEIGASNYC